MSSALASGFLTTRPPEKWFCLFVCFLILDVGIYLYERNLLELLLQHQVLFYVYFHFYLSKGIDFFFDTLIAQYYVAEILHSVLCF